MIYGSVCSGIEAATVAWHPLGWTPAWYSEIEPFPSAVLKHHYPAVPNRGDMTKYKEWPNEPVDLLVGGTPCQSFSVAGLRKGMDDARGNLALVYLGLVDRLRPRWVVWEIVPGVLSVDGGRAFGAFIGGLAELGYGWAYRILDAQNFGVPQRRRRVFVVGPLGDWRRAAAVLFEPESMRRDTPPGRTKGQRIAPGITSRSKSGGGFGTDHDCDGGLITASDLSPTVLPGPPFSRTGSRADAEALVYVPPIVPQAMSRKWAKGSSGPAGDEVANLVVTHALPARYDSGEDGTGRGVPILLTMREGKEGGGKGPLVQVDRSAALATGNGQVLFNVKIGNQGGWAPPDVPTYPILASSSVPGVAVLSGVRRLTPRECERLQGFPDDYTLIPYKGRSAKDGPRYKALGNSMAVPVMRWIGQRIQMVEDCI